MEFRIRTSQWTNRVLPRLGGSQEINRYLQWAGKELKDQYGVNFNHVKVTDIAETGSRLLAEKAAGKHNGGSVDMVWINGENFKSMKDNALLYGPFVSNLPNWQYVDKSLPVDSDFSEPPKDLKPLGSRSTRVHPRHASSQ